MNEAVFPLLGTAFVVLFVLPAFALVAKALLLVLEREEISGPLHGLDLRYFVLAGSSALPLAWLLSAGLHQAETGESVLACLFDHEGAALCFEPGLFAAALGAAVVFSAVRTVRKHKGDPPSASPRTLATALTARLERIVRESPALGDLRGRVTVTADPGFALGTYGLLAPRVFIGASFASALSDEMLAGALGHEREHVRARDPLRYLLLQVALGVIPFGERLLGAHARRWKAAREAHCDREAVIEGARPLPLADAIVKAARPSLREAAVALGTRDTAVLKLRVTMLLAFAERPPARCCRRGVSVFPIACALLLLALLLPHQTGTAALDVLHVGAERALTYFWN